MPNKIKVQAKDVSEAIAKGLKELGLRRDQVEVTVLETPKKGFLGFGSRPAVVELRQKRWNSSNLDAQIYMDVPKKRSNKSHAHGGRNNRKDRGEVARGNRRTRRNDHSEARETRERLPKANEPQLLPSEAIQNAVIPENLKAPMQEAKEYLEKVLTHMGVKVENLHVWWDEKQQRILLTFDCDHPAIVIGKEGKTLEAIQYLSTLALSRHFDKPISVITDTQNYWRKAEDKIDAEIEKGIDMIKRGNSVFRFRPMSAQLRRYIHRAVEGNEFVVTASEGEGKWRKVTLRPTEKAVAALTANAAPADFVPGVIGEDLPEEQKGTENACDTCATKTEEACAACEAKPEVTVEVKEETVVTVETPCAACETKTEEDCAACQAQPAAEQPAEVKAEEKAAEPAPAAEQPAAEPAAAAQPAEVKTDAPAESCGPLFDAPAQTEENK